MLGKTVSENRNVNVIKLNEILQLLFLFEQLLFFYL